MCEVSWGGVETTGLDFNRKEHKINVHLFMSNGWAGLHRKEALNLKWWSKKKTHPSGEVEKLNSWHVHRDIIIAYIFCSFGRLRFYYMKNAVSEGSGHRLDDRRTWSISRMILMRGKRESICKYNATQQRSHNHSCPRKKQCNPFVIWDTSSQNCFHGKVTMGFIRLIDIQNIPYCQ